MSKLPRLSLTVVESTGVAGHQSLACDHRAYCDLATDRQQRTNGIVRKHHALTALTSETPPSLTRCAKSPHLPWVVGHGCITQLPPSIRA